VNHLSVYPINLVTVSPRRNWRAVFLSADLAGRWQKNSKRNSTIRHFACNGLTTDEFIWLINVADVVDKALQFTKH